MRTIKLNEDRAMVRAFAIHDNVKLYADTIASIKHRGIIGEKFMALSPGGGGEPLKSRWQDSRYRIGLSIWKNWSVNSFMET